MSLYELIDFSKLRESDIQEAREFYGTNFESVDMIKKTAIAENPRTLSNGLGALVRGHYLQTNIVQPFKYSIEFLGNHDLKSFDKLIQLNPADYYYDYNTILSFYYAGWLTDPEKVNHPEFKRLVGLSDLELRKWGRQLRIPVINLNRGQLLSKILENKFTIDTVGDIGKNVSDVKQYRFDNIVQAINNNMRIYKDLTSQSMTNVQFFDDVQSLPFLLVQNYKDSNISYSLIPIKDKGGIDLNNALYVNDLNELVMGPYFPGVSRFLESVKVEELLNKNSMELFMGDSIYNLSFVTKEMLITGQYHKLSVKGIA